MKTGILYIAFGEVYDKVAAHAVAYSRRFTHLPICVLTNLRNRCEKWNSISNVEFRDLQLPFEKNRDIKTRMIQYSPFDLTMYMDCDSVIQKSGVENLFDIPDTADVSLFVDLFWGTGDKVLDIYKRMMQQTGVEPPILIYSGGLQLFKKNKRTDQMFKLWNEYWKLAGSGRDMPALNCAVAQSNVRIEHPPDRLFAAECKRPDAVIQHRYSGDFCEKFGIPLWKPWKKFDKRHDFSWVDF